MPLIHCIMASPSPPDAAAKCLSGLGIVTTSAARIEQCAASARGEALLHEVGIRTQTLDPPLDFVPWLTFNDVSDQRTALAVLTVCDCAGVLLEGDGGGSEQPDLGAVLPLPARWTRVRGVPRPLCVTST